MNEDVRTGSIRSIQGELHERMTAELNPLGCKKQEVRIEKQGGGTDRAQIEAQLWN